MAEAHPRAVSMSLAGRVALAVGAVLLVGGLVVLVAALTYGRQAAREAYDRLLVGAANDIAASISIRDGRAIVDLPVSAFELLALAPDDRVIYRVVGPDGQTLTGYDSAPMPEPDRGDGIAFFDADFGGETARYVRVARRFAERSYSGTVHVVVGHTTRARRALAFDITRNALAVLAVSGAAMAVLAILAVRSALRPLDRIGEALRRRDRNDLTPVDLTVPREAAVMLRALNDFMGRLERQVAAMGNLIGDAAHQLRTPVAAIRAQAELAAEEPDPARRRQIVERIHLRAVGLGRLLDQMLSRALVIHRSDSVAHVSVDLRDIAVEVLEGSDHDILPGADDVGIELPPQPVMVRGDPLSLAEAARNLLNNARRHGRAPVRIGVTDEGAQVSLWVADAGAGPPDEIMTRAGERFARAAAARSDSAGLGLAIAMSAAAAHGGTLRMDRLAGGGFVASLVLPAAGAPA